MTKVPQNSLGRLVILGLMSGALTFCAVPKAPYSVLDTSRMGFREGSLAEAFLQYTSQNISYQDRVCVAVVKDKPVSGYNKTRNRTELVRKVRERPLADFRSGMACAASASEANYEAVAKLNAILFIDVYEVLKATYTGEKDGFRYFRPYMQPHAEGQAILDQQEKAERDYKFAEQQRVQKKEEENYRFKCADFGFGNNTDAMNNCIAQLKLANEQAEIMRRQAASIDAAREAERIKLKAEQRQRALSRTLLGIGAGLLDPPQPSSAGNMFKTCYYTVVGETVPFPVSSTSICPPSRDFGGVTGFLQ